MTDHVKYFGTRFTVPEDKKRLRYFRVSVIRQPRADGATFVDDPLTTGSYSIPGSIPIVPGSVGSISAAGSVCLLRCR